MNHAKSLPAFPAEGRDVFQALKNEVAWLHAKHKIWKQLYDTDEQRIELMNEMAKSFFAVLQTVLIRDILLGIARLTDPAAMGRRGEKQNLTISRLLLLLKQSCSAEFHGQLVEQLANIGATCADFVGWRHRVLAHNDLPTALNRDLVPRLEREKIDTAMAQIRKLMNHVDGHFFDSEMGYEHYSLNGDGDTIIYYLEEAKAFQRAKLEAMARGLNVNPNEIDPKAT